MNAPRIGLIAIFSAGLVIAGCSSQQSDWQHAQQQNTVAAYQKFIKQYPDSDHVQDAKQQIAHIKQQREVQQARADWQQAEQMNTKVAYQQFLQSHPNSQYTDQAHQRLQQMQIQQDWTYASSSGNVVALRQFASKYPNSPRAQQARQMIAKLQAQQQKAQQQQQQQQQQVATAQPSSAQNPQQTAQAQPQGDYQLQLAAFSEQDRAKKGQQLIEHQYSDLLGDVQVEVVAPQSGSSLYKLKTTAMSRDDATSLCQSLKDKGQDCFVVRRSGSATQSISK